MLAPIPNSFCVNYVPYSFLTPRHRQTTDERWLIFLIGLSPPPGTPEAALSLRKYHCNRYLSSLFSEAVREFSQRAQLLRKGAVPRECRLSLSPDNNGNVSVAGIFNFVNPFCFLGRKDAIKNGHDKNNLKSCLSCPISMVSILTRVIGWI